MVDRASYDAARIAMSYEFAGLGFGSSTTSRPIISRPDPNRTFPLKAQSGCGSYRRMTSKSVVSALAGCPNRGGDFGRMMSLVVSPGRSLNEVEHTTRVANREELRGRIERRTHASVVTPCPSRRHSLPETNCAPSICPLFQIDF